MIGIDSTKERSSVRGDAGWGGGGARGTIPRTSDTSSALDQEYRKVGGPKLVNLDETYLE